MKVRNQSLSNTEMRDQAAIFLEAEKLEKVRKQSLSNIEMRDQAAKNPQS
jgi:hypothetical protein